MIRTFAALRKARAHAVGPAGVTPPSSPAYVVESRDRRKLAAQSIAPVIRETLVQMLESGWIDGTEHAAIGYLMGTDAPLPEEVAP